MLRRPPRITRLLALLACLPLPASSAGATEILIDAFSGTPALGIYVDRGANGLGQILPFATAQELDYLGDLLGMHLEYGSLGGVDLTATGNNALSLTLLSLVPTVGPLKIAVSVNGGAPTSTEFSWAPGTLSLPYTLLLPFSDPTAFSSVNSLRLEFSSTTNFAFAADDLKAIPEPASAAMLGLGLLGLALVGRRRAPTAARGLAGQRSRSN